MAVLYGLRGTIVIILNLILLILIKEEDQAQCKLVQLVIMQCISEEHNLTAIL